MKRSDRQLVADYLNGDEKSLEILIQRYLKPIYGFARKYTNNSQDAEDITQEVFIKMWRNLKKFNQKQNFKTWIFSIAKNTAIDFLRKRKNLSFSDLDFIDPSLIPEESAEQRGIGEALVGAMEKLSPKYQLVLSLVYDKRLTFREIAETLGEPLNTVKSRHYRALLSLKKLFSLSGQFML